MLYTKERWKNKNIALLAYTKIYRSILDIRRNLLIFSHLQLKLHQEKCMFTMFFILAMQCSKISFEFGTASCILLVTSLQVESITEKKMKATPIKLVCYFCKKRKKKRARTKTRFNALIVFFLCAKHKGVTPAQNNGNWQTA